MSNRAFRDRRETSPRRLAIGRKPAAVRREFALNAHRSRHVRFTRTTDVGRHIQSQHLTVALLSARPQIISQGAGTPLHNHTWDAVAHSINRCTAHLPSSNPTLSATYWLLPSTSWCLQTVSTDSSLFLPPHAFIRRSKAPASALDGVLLRLLLLHAHVHIPHASGLLTIGLGFGL